MSTPSSPTSSNLVKWLVTGGVATTVAVGGFLYFSSRRSKQQQAAAADSAPAAAAAATAAAGLPDLLLTHTSEVDRRFLATDPYLLNLCIRSVPYAEYHMDAWKGLIVACSVLAKEMYKVNTTPQADVRPSFVTDVEKPVNAMNRALLDLRQKLMASVRSSGSQSAHVRKTNTHFGYFSDDATHYGNACVNNALRKVQLQVLDV